jgi:hypothetical protein
MHRELQPSQTSFSLAPQRSSTHDGAMGCVVLNRMTQLGVPVSRRVA